MEGSPAGQLERAREQARTDLAEGYAHDLIDQDQLDQRLDAVERAVSHAELDALTADLRPVQTAALVPVASSLPAVAAAQQQLRVLFGALDRTGVWSIAARTRLRVSFGSATLDLRQAVLPPGPIELEVRVVFGSLDLIVPGWQVENECGAILGAVEQVGGPPPAGERQVLRLTGRVIFSSLTIHERLPGEDARDTHKRHKRERAERRENAERSARALPKGRE